MRVERFEVGNVIVHPHAITRARERWELDCSDAGVAAIVEATVRRWVASGLVFDRKPRQFRPYADDGFVPPWQRLVGTEDKAVIVALDQKDKTVVVTVLSRAAKIAGVAPRGRKGRARA